MHTVLVVTHSYPSELAPFKAKFIQDQVLLFNNSDEYKVTVLHLTPKTIPFTSRFKELHEGYTAYGEIIECKTYFSFPRRTFPNKIQTNISSALLSYLSKKSFDTIHLHWLFPAGLTIKKLKEKGYRVIITIHGSDWYKSIAKPKLKELVVESLKYADKILFSGPKLRNDVLSVIPELSKKSILIYNFIDSHFYRLPNTKEKLEKKKLLSFDINKTHVLTVASLREEKGIDILIEAIRKLDTTKLHFHIVGLIEKTNYADSILNMIQQFGLNERVTLHGIKTPTELVNYYFASDLYVLPSRSEGFNLSILESTATGLPVLCTDAGGNSMVVDDRMGIIVPTENPEKLSNKLTFMFNNLDSFDPVYISNQTISKYSEKNMKEKLVKIYSELNSL